MRKKPIIGLTTRPRNEEGKYTLSGLYTDAVLRAGGIPVLLTPGGEVEDDLLDLLDGLILSGGGDIDPSYYGGKPHPNIYGVDQERDRFEISLVKKAVEKRMPLLPICRGIQVLNVALGGTLIEHVPDMERENDIVHRVDDDPEGILHTITLNRNSKIFSIVGQESFEAVSWHHQAIGRIAPGLIETGRAPDGIVESLEMPGHPFLVAVQWHPEMSAIRDPLQQKLFAALVDASKSRQFFTGKKQ